MKDEHEWKYKKGPSSKKQIHTPVCLVEDTSTLIQTNNLDRSYKMNTINKATFQIENYDIWTWGCKANVENTNEIVLDSGIHATDSWFQVLHFRFLSSGTWIPDFNHQKDFKCLGQNFRNPESWVLPYMGQSIFIYQVENVYVITESHTSFIQVTYKIFQKKRILYTWRVNFQNLWQRAWIYTESCQHLSIQNHSALTADVKNSCGESV